MEVLGDRTGVGGGQDQGPGETQATTVKASLRASSWKRQVVGPSPT
jgi:hypothetical protein